jgi:hypothetical protein
MEATHQLVEEAMIEDERRLLVCASHDVADDA